MAMTDDEIKMWRERSDTISELVVIYMETAINLSKQLGESMNVYIAPEIIFSAMVSIETSLPKLIIPKV